MIDFADITVLDGDTIVIAGEHIRILGMDAPETFHARCDDELEFGDRATIHLMDILGRGPVELARRSGKDKYGRTLARVTVDGRDVATIMIRDGMAVPYNGKGRRKQWC